MRLTELSLNSGDIALARLEAGQQSVSISDYFRSSMPTRSAGNDWYGGSFLHTQDVLPVCRGGPQCALPMTVIGVETSWPDILQVIPETRATTPEAFHGMQPVTFPLAWSLPSRPPSHSLIEYTLVGRILHHSRPAPGHFTARVIIGDRAYEYDDNANGGRLQDIGRDVFATKASHNVVMVVYHKTSDETVHLYPHYRLFMTLTNGMNICLDILEAGGRYSQASCCLSSSGRNIPTRRHCR